MTTHASEMLTFRGMVSDVQAYLARPQTLAKSARPSLKAGEGRWQADEARPAVIVIHEIYGLTNHTRDVADRFAQQGYVALAPHLYSRPGLVDVLTESNMRAAMQFRFSLPPERQMDMAFVQQELARQPEDKRMILQKVVPLMFGGLPKDDLTQDLVKAVEYLKAQAFVRADKISSVGFCFGGGMSINLACHTPLAACVIFYGENPSPIDRLKNIAGPVLGLYGAEDYRINQHLDQLVKAMVEYKKDFEMRIYPNAAHAFFNDTNPATYREAAARAAWDQVLRFYRRALDEV